jgi:tellurite resistance protein
MGLFDDVFRNVGPQNLSVHEAFAGILLTATACDGHISDEETRGLCTILARMKLYDNWTGDKMNQILNRLMGMIKRDGVDKVLESCAHALPQELHKTAFANACDLVLADGGVEDAEKDFMNKVVRYLGLPGDDARTIARVMVIKNRG